MVPKGKERAMRVLVAILAFLFPAELFILLILYSFYRRRFKAHRTQDQVDRPRARSPYLCPYGSQEI